MSNPFVGGLAPNLIPNPPGEIPEAFQTGDAMAMASPFSEPLDWAAIAKNLVLDRPLKLYVPDKEKYPEFEFRIINSIPQEIADAHNKGFREITEPKMVELFIDTVAGTDKVGKAFRPILMARHKSIGAEVAKRRRKQLKSLYEGMNPANKDMSGKYTINVDAKDGTKAEFSGANWRIRV